MSVLHDEDVLFLTAAEVAKILRFGEPHVRSLAGDGHLPGAICIGQRWRFNRAILAKYLGVETADAERADEGVESCGEHA